MKYNIFLNNVNIGSSDLENADPPMGVVSGQINFQDKNFDYNFFRNYCKINTIKTEEYPEDQFISTQIIANLKVYNKNGIEISGNGCYIAGMDSEGFEINIIGIPYPLYQEEFPQHVSHYQNKFK